MISTVLSLFFIPTFKWNRRYYVQTTCCGTTYELNPEIGMQIARGENVEIKRGRYTDGYGDFFFDFIHTNMIKYGNHPF